MLVPVAALLLLLIVRLPWRDFAMMFAYRSNAQRLSWRVREDKLGPRSALWQKLRERRARMLKQARAAAAVRQQRCDQLRRDVFGPESLFTEAAQGGVQGVPSPKKR